MEACRIVGGYRWYEKEAMDGTCGEVSICLATRIAAGSSADVVVPAA